MLQVHHRPSLQTAFIALTLLCCTLHIHAQNTVIDATKKRQHIETIGLNANPQSWDVNPDSVKHVLDQLIDSLGCRSFRLMFDDCDWEKVNDNNDPHAYNWTYYDSVYSSPRFKGIWEMIRYLNTKGVTDIGLSPDGATPAWMGVTVLKPGLEAEYAEMIASMITYTKKRLPAPLQYGLISPINETTCGGGEGVVTTPQQFQLLYAEVARHLIADTIDNVRIVGPDDCGGWKANVEAMLADSVIMSKLAYFGQHDYGTQRPGKAIDLIATIRKSKYPATMAVMSEVNAPCIDCDGGVYNKDYGFDAYAGPAYGFILNHLNAGVNGIQIWEAYDSRYHHPNRTLTWSMWGLFAINDTLHPDVYTARPHMDVCKLLFRFVRSGDHRIEAATQLPGVTLSAFADSSNKKFVVTGINRSDKPQRIDALLKGVTSSALQYYSMNQGHGFERGADVKLKKNRLLQVVPPHTAFTLTSAANE